MWQTFNIISQNMCRSKITQRIWKLLTTPFHTAPSLNSRNLQSVLGFVLRPLPFIRDSSKSSVYSGRRINSPPVKRSFAYHGGCYPWHGAPFNITSDGHKIILKYIINICIYIRRGSRNFFQGGSNLDVQWGLHLRIGSTSEPLLRISFHVLKNNDTKIAKMLWT